MIEVLNDQQASSISGGLAITVAPIIDVNPQNIIDVAIQTGVANAIAVGVLGGRAAAANFLAQSIVKSLVNIS